MSRFDKFLSKQPTVSIPETKPKRLGGRPRKAPHLKHPRSKDLDKLDPATGRIRKELLKRPKQAGRRNPSVKRKVRKLRDKRHYQRRRLQQKAYRDSLKRKYYQHRSVARLNAAKRGVDPAAYYQLDYATFLLIWETAPAIYLFEKQCMVEAKSLIDNPLKRKYQCTYLDRLDRTKPFTRENVKVFYKGKPLED